jgi:single-stranded DNA-binding protein
MAKSKYGPLNQVVGNVGRDPEEFDTKVGPVVRFSVARNMGYGDDAPPPRWISVAVFNDDIRPQVLEKIRKGSRVALEGTITESEYDGKTQYNMVAVRVGLIEWFLRSQSSAPSRKDRDEDESDGGLDW